MSDIVKWLREEAIDESNKNDPQPRTIEKLREAADVIERLEGNNKGLVLQNALLRQRPDLPVDRIPAAGMVEQLRSAALALIEDVRRRYPGEELRCQYMRALDEALEGKT